MLTRNFPMNNGSSYKIREFPIMYLKICDFSVSFYEPYKSTTIQTVYLSWLVLNCFYRYVQSIQNIFYHFVRHGELKNTNSLGNNQAFMIDQDIIPFSFSNCDFWFANDIVPRHGRTDWSVCLNDEMKGMCCK